MLDDYFSLCEISVNYSNPVPAQRRILVTTSTDAVSACRMFWPSYEHVEYFYVLLLNRANHIIGFYQVSKGGFTGTAVDVRVIYQVALKICATSIIVAHNHPSGNLNASDADINLTKKIKEAGKLLDITLLDHVILTETSYRSLADEGHV